MWCADCEYKNAGANSSSDLNPNMVLNCKNFSDNTSAKEPTDSLAHGWDLVPQFYRGKLKVEYSFIFVFSLFIFPGARLKMGSPDR
jgi:hypothetical protein